MRNNIRIKKLPLAGVFESFKCLFVAVGEEVLVVGRGVKSLPALMGDAAPVSLGSSGDFFGKEEKAVDVAAVGAIQFLEYIEVGEFLAIDFDIIAPFHILESIEREANAMVDFQYDVE